MGTIGETQWAEMKLRQSQQDAADLFKALGPDGDELKITDDEAAAEAQIEEAEAEAEALAAAEAGEEPAAKKSTSKAKASTAKNGD